LTGRNFGSQGFIAKAAEVLVRANDVAKDVENDQQKAYNYTLIAEFLADIGEKEKAGEILSEAYRIANHIDDTEVRITTMDRIAYLLEKDNQFDEARDVEENINETITNSAAPDRVVAYYIMHAKYDEAFDNAVRIDNPYSRAYTLAEIGKQSWLGDAKPLASDVLGVAVETSGQIEDRFFRERARVQLSAVYCDLGQPEKAATIVELLEKEDTKARALQALARAYSNLGRYNLALSTAGKIDIPRYKSNAHYYIGLALLKKDQTLEALVQLDQARQSAEGVSLTHLQDKIRSKIVEAYVMAGQPETGLELADLINDIYYKEMAWYNVAEHYHAAGDDEETMKLADRIENPYFKSSILTWQAKRKDFS
jgi:tetratricopeptide (TPR) repeat protein